MCPGSFFILFYLARITRLLFPDVHTYTPCSCYVMLPFFPLYRVTVGIIALLPFPSPFRLYALFTSSFHSPQWDERERESARVQDKQREKRRVPNCSPYYPPLLRLCVIVPCIDPSNPIQSFPFLSSSSPFFSSSFSTPRNIPTTTSTHARKKNEREDK